MMIAPSKSANSSSGSSPALHEAIRRRADEIYRRSGNLPGCDLENWVQAEAEVLSEAVVPQPHKTAIVVKVSGILYVGEYDPESSLDYAPGEFQTGVPLPVRFDGDKMYIRRPNGVELETTIVLRDLEHLHDNLHS